MSHSYRRLALLLSIAAPLFANEFSTYIGNANSDFKVARIVSDSAGNTYIAGNRIYNSQVLTEAPVSTVFVMKLDPTGSTVLYATFGGTGTDTANDLAVDAAGNIYIGGATSSPVFPIHNALQSTPGTGFLVKLNPDATGFIWSTYFPESILALAVDSAGNVYVAGDTISYSFPATSGISYGRVDVGEPGGSSGAFLTKISAAGDRIVYSSVIAGSSKPCSGGSSCFLSERFTGAAAVAVDPAGNAYLAGNTDTTDLPTTPGSLMPSGIGAFAMKINAAGTAIAWLTYIGPTGYSYPAPLVTYANSATAIAVDPAGNAYVVGSTFDPKFPATAGAYQTAFASPLASNPAKAPTDAFVVELNGSGGAVWATYFGGQAADAASAVAVDSSGNAWVSGTTASANFPNAQGWSEGSDFVVGFNPSGSALSYAARYPAGAVAQSIASDPGGFLHLAGSGGLISTLRLGQPPVARVFGVANAAFGGLQGIVSPTEVISIYGPGIGPATPVSAAPDSSGLFPKSLGGVQVSIGGAPAPLLYVSASRIDAVVPGYLPGAGEQIYVTVNSAALPAFTASTAPTDPQVFRNADGSAAAINQDNTINSAAHPAQPGSIVSIWATGTGRSLYSIPDGQVIAAAQDYSCCFVVFETSASEVTPVNVYYAGAAPGLVMGLTQINFQVPPSGSTFRVGAGDGISDPVQIHVGPSSLRRPFERRNRVEQQPEDHAGGVNRGR
jgi:uncharacterized protein (TIGR03437 family)